MSVPALAFACQTPRCTGPLHRFDPPAYLRVRRHRVAELVLPVTIVCTGCGRLVEPSDLASEGYRSSAWDVLGALKVESRRRGTGIDRAVGLTGKWSDLKLPSWFDLVAHARLVPDVRDRDVQWQGDKQRFNVIRHHLGLAADDRSLVVGTLAGRFQIDDRTAGHIRDRSDAGHSQLVRLVQTTLRQPLEVWNDGEKLRFLSLYKVGPEDRWTTHLVVAHISERRILTGYEVDGAKTQPNSALSRESVEERTNRKRSGTCIRLDYKADQST